MNLRTQTRELVQKEKHYTALILKNLAEVERRKLYCDYGYPSLFKYLTKELRYSDSEAHIRVAAVRLTVRKKSVAKDVASGKLSLTNAAQIQTSLNQHEKESGCVADERTVQRALELSLNQPTRTAKEELRKEFNLKTPRTERVILDERILEKVDRVRKIYGDRDLSAYEILDILLEEKLKTPKKPLQRKGDGAAKNSRHISASTKAEVHRGKCQNCGSNRNLQYDHIKEYALGGTNGADNIQMLCENCNQRKEIKRKEDRQAGLFG